MTRYAHVTAWHLRCVEAWAAQVAVTGWGPPFSGRLTAAIHVETRLRDDLKAGSLDALHGQAQWIDAEWTATHARHRQRLRDEGNYGSRFSEEVVEDW